MIRRTGPQRDGVTLLEVLTAIFIMGIGLLAILTLFPLGALSMARAVRDDRAAHIVANATAFANAMDLRHDRYVTEGFNIGWGVPAVAGTTVASDRSGPSNLVIVDPAYVKLNGDPYLGPLIASTALPAAAKFGGQDGGVRVAPNWVRDPNPVIPEPTTAPANYPRFIDKESSGKQGGADTSKNPPVVDRGWSQRWFTFQDEIEFKKIGVPNGSGSLGVNTISRPGTYSWSYVIRRTRYNWPELAELSVIVYASRSVDVQSGELSFAVKPVNINYPPNSPIGTSVIKMDHGGSKPNIRRGAWLLDVTLVVHNKNPFVNSTQNVNKQVINGDFYRVETVTEVDSTHYQLELDRPVKYPFLVQGATDAPEEPSPAAAQPFFNMYKVRPNRMIWLENAITVVEKGTTWNP